MEGRDGKKEERWEKEMDSRRKECVSVRWEGGWKAEEAREGMKNDLRKMIHHAKIGIPDSQRYP